MEIDSSASELHEKLIKDTRYHRKEDLANFDEDRWPIHENDDSKYQRNQRYEDAKWQIDQELSPDWDN